MLANTNMWSSGYSGSVDETEVETELVLVNDVSTESEVDHSGVKVRGISVVLIFVEENNERLSPDINADCDRKPEILFSKSEGSITEFCWLIGTNDSNDSGKLAGITLEDGCILCRACTGDEIMSENSRVCVEGNKCRSSREIVNVSEVSACDRYETCER